MAMEFFDLIPYTTTAQFLTAWSGYGHSSYNGFNADAPILSIGTSLGRFSGQNGVQIRSNRGDIGGCVFQNLANAATRYFAVSLFFPASYIGAVSSPNVTFADGNTPQINFAVDASGHVAIYRNSTLLVTGSLVVSLNAYHRFEFKVKVDASVGVAQCYVDGVLYATFSGNTQASGNAYSNRIAINNGVNGSLATLPLNFCDPIIYTDTGAAPNGFLGDKRFYINYSSGNGTVSQYTQNTSAWPSSTAVPLSTTILDSNSNLQRVTAISGTGTTGGSAPTWNITVGGTTTDNPGGNQVVWTNIGPVSDYKFVNEMPPDDDYNYLSDSTPGHEVGFTCPALPTTVTGIIGVGLQMRSRKDDAGTRSLRVEIKSGSAIADNGSDLAQLTSWAYYEGFFPNDPNTSAAWTRTAVNNAEERVKTIS